MLEKIILAGFGGQGVLFAGKLLAFAGMMAGKEVAWIPSYGPEMRGGTANCSVTISDKRISSPIVDEPDSALIFNGPSLEKFLPLIKPQGLLMVNSFLVEKRSIRKDISCMWIDVQKAAEDAGASKAANLVMLGAYLGEKEYLAWDYIKGALVHLLAGKKEELLKGNLRALENGRKIIQG